MRNLEEINTLTQKILGGCNEKNDYFYYYGFIYRK